MNCLFTIGLIINSVDCSLCETAVSAGESWLNDNQDIIIKEVDTICDKIPDKSYSALCSQLAPEIIKDSISYIESNASPEEICDMSGLCTTDFDTDSCNDCELFASSIYNYISNEDDQQVILNDLESYCVDSQYKTDECVEFIQSHGPFVLNYISEFFVDPQSVCSEIKLC